MFETAGPFGLVPAAIQTFMCLKLAVDGHLIIFVTRTRGPFRSVAPAPVLLWSAIATKVLATLAAVYGIFMAPIDWKWAALIWAYALAWLLLNDRIKLLAYRIFDRNQPSVLAASLRSR